MVNARADKRFKTISSLFFETYNSQTYLTELSWSFLLLKIYFSGESQTCLKANLKFEKLWDGN